MPTIHGHRGARGRRPENTFAAFEYALQHRADGIEVDICATADDALVVHHDLHLNPDTTRDARGQWVTTRVPIRALSLTELRQYDVGRLNPAGDYAKRFPEQQPADGAHIPTLDECIHWFQQHAATGTVLNIELKNDAARPSLTPSPEHYVQMVLEKLQSSTLSPAQILLQSFDWHLMHIAKKLCPRFTIGVTKDSPYTLADITAAKNQNANTFSAAHQDTSAEKIAHAHALGLEVNVWTVNDKDAIKKIAALGVDTITSDYPDRCWEVLSA